MISLHRRLSVMQSTGKGGKEKNMIKDPQFTPKCLPNVWDARERVNIFQILNSEQSALASALQDWNFSRRNLTLDFSTLKHPQLHDWNFSWIIFEFGFEHVKSSQPWIPSIRTSRGELWQCGTVETTLYTGKLLSCLWHTNIETDLWYEDRDARPKTWNVIKTKCSVRSDWKSKNSGNW